MCPQGHVSQPNSKCGGGRCIDCYVAGIPISINQAAPRGAQWRDKGETIYSPQEHAAYEPNLEHWGSSNDVPDSTAPSRPTLTR